MMKMKSIYRKTGIMVAVLALLVVMSAPTAVAVVNDTITATWVPPNIVATASNFDHPDKWYQIRVYQPGTNYDKNNPGAVGPYDSNNLTGYFTSDEWKPEDEGGVEHTYTLYNVDSLPNYEGEWTIWLFKAGVSENPPEEGVTSARVWTTLTVPIPEFATIAIPVVALLGLFAFYRRKQKK